MSNLHRGHSIDTSYQVSVVAMFDKKWISVAVEELGFIHIKRGSMDEISLTISCRNVID
jgi:hypothetical protein